LTKKNKKTFVVDTNVFLYDPTALYVFAEHDVVIAFAVIEEFDKFKSRMDDVGRNAREISRQLDHLRMTGDLSYGIKLPQGGTLRVEINHQQMEDCPQKLDLTKPDNRILAVAWNLKRDGRNVVMVSKDLNLRIKADVLGIRAEDYANKQINYRDLYESSRELEVADRVIDSLYSGRRCFDTTELETEKGADGPKFYPHELLILRSRENRSKSVLTRYARTKLHALSPERSYFGITARNKEQRFALELLARDEIKIVSLIGKAGTGKTLLALAVGLDKILDNPEGLYKKLLVVRPIIPVGNDIGYLPGAKERKLDPWMQPIYDNLEYLTRNWERSPAENTKRGDKNGAINTGIDHLLDRGIVQLETFTYVRGRSIPNQFIICDEAQNLSPQIIKTIVTRVGEGSKIVFTGDPEQIDSPYLDASSNGLTYLAERLKNEEITGHVTLFKGERSEVAELGAKLL